MISQVGNDRSSAVISMENWQHCIMNSYFNSERSMLEEIKKVQYRTWFCDNVNERRR